MHFSKSFLEAKQTKIPFGTDSAILTKTFINKPRKSQLKENPASSIILVLS